MTEAETPFDDASVEPEDPATRARIFHVMAALESAGRHGANWFFWIAGLSLANTVVAHLDGGVQFIVGLAVTGVVDVISLMIIADEPDFATLVTTVAAGFSVVVSLGFITCGWLSRRRYLWVFAGGMILYLFDGLLCLIIDDLFGAAFHCFALYWMYQGFKSFRKLNKIDAAIAEHLTTTATRTTTNPELEWEAP